MRETDEACRRCIQRNIQCVRRKKDLQSLLDEQQVWRQGVEHDMRTLKESLEKVNATLEQLAQQQAFEPPRKRHAVQVPQPQIYTTDDSMVTEGLLGLAGQLGTGSSQAAEPELRGTRREQRPSCTGTASPRSHPTTSPSLDPLPDESSAETCPDILSSGVVSLSQTVDLFYFFFRVLDPHICHLVAPIHGVEDLSEQASRPGTPLNPYTQRMMLLAIESVRNASNLLFVAILCVAALHMRLPSSGQRLYPILYREYIRLSAIQAFSRHQTLDDIRGLVVGSFWLNDVSWTLVGTAVRIVTERHMHESYARWVPSVPLLRRKRQHNSLPSARSVSDAGRTPPAGQNTSQSQMAYEEARLYYLIYIADHQCSIPYRRPPMTRQHEVVRRAMEWLGNCPWAENRSDTRLVALVKLWEILHDAIDEIGSDLYAPLDELGLAFHARFQSQIEAWYQTWAREFSVADSFARYDMNRQRLYAELFLHSMAFRADKDALPILFPSQVTEEMMGESNSAVNHACFQAERRRMVSESAVDAAHQILQLLAGDLVRLETLIGSTSYSHTMTTFAIVLLVKALKQFGNEEDSQHLRRADLRSILRSIDPALRTLVAAAKEVATDNILVSITAKAKHSIEQIRAAFKSMHPEGYLAPIPQEYDPIPSPQRQPSQAPIIRKPSLPHVPAWVQPAQPARQQRSSPPTQEQTTQEDWVCALDSLQNFDLLSGQVPLSGIDLFRGTSLGMNVNNGVDANDLSSILAAPTNN